jgi:acetylornithine deacetylase/succinyl-diaminopimelate desuccinylase-like protein
MGKKEDLSHIYQNPVELLQKLIRFDTTNPPGNESDCIAFVNHLLTQAGIATKILAKSQDRPNLIARFPGQGTAAPLLLYPPFAGKLVDEFIYGRGALDMKGGVTMMLAALLRAKAENLRPPGDIILAIVCDEEAFGDYGAKFLVENHPEEFDGIRYAIGEFGGFTVFVGNRRFYPIQISEKQLCCLKATFRGPGGHGSLPVRGGAMAKLSQFLQRLDKRRLPVHITPPARLMISAMASSLGGISYLILNQLLNPRLTDCMLNLLGERGNLFDPLLHNTVSPTILHASNKINVIPSEVSVELDCRLLPGFQPDDLIGELLKIVEDTLDIDVIRFDPGPGPSVPNMGLFDTLAGILKEADPNGTPVPTLLSAVTDGRFFSRIGIQTYGYLPMLLPKNFSFIQTIHAADERIPINAVEFGTNAIYQVLQRFGV